MSSPHRSGFDADDEDVDTASQRSISLLSPAQSPRRPTFDEEYEEAEEELMEELNLHDPPHTPHIEPKTPRPHDIFPGVPTERNHAQAVGALEEDPDIIDTDVSSEDDASILRVARLATTANRSLEPVSLLSTAEVERPEPTPVARSIMQHEEEPEHELEPEHGHEAEPEPSYPQHDSPDSEAEHLPPPSASFLRPDPGEIEPDPESFFTSTVSSASEMDDRSLYTTEMTDHDTEYLNNKRDSSITSAVPSVADDPFSRHEVKPQSETEEHVEDEEEEMKGITLSPLSSPPPTITSYPPPPPLSLDTESIADSLASGTSKKARPESLLVEPGAPSLILGVALVDFNHMVGPRIEFSRGDIFEDEEIAKILPFLALPDGAHLSSEDYSYFHVVPSNPNPTTVFGISCNRQIQAAELLAKGDDVTRSTVQKAVVVLASKPLFGPIRDKLGVVTRTLFHQRDFREMGLLDDFYVQLESSLRAQLTESSLYMGTSLRELVHTFRQRTLVLVKALMLQKKILFYGHPVEKLCTHQYSLVTLFPGLLQTLEDCGSPPLAARAPTLRQPNTLKTSDRKSLMAYLGLPLDIFGKDSFFQPYLPLQQMDMLHTRSWLCGTTNSIVTQQKDIDLIVNIETNTFEFRNPDLERVAGLTPADRKWMDDIVRDVNESWVEGDLEARPSGLHGFKGSDDYLRTKFEEYIHGALASIKFQEFLAKGKTTGVMISDGTGADATTIQDFNPLWMAGFRRTNAYEVWNRITDPMLFDISEPRHPCGERISVVSDISLRLSEGIQELKIDQQLAPAREAISRTISSGSANFFKAVDGVRGRWLQRSPSDSPTPESKQLQAEPATPGSPSPSPKPGSEGGSVRDSVVSNESGSAGDSSRPISVNATTTTEQTKSGSWGASWGSFISSRAARFSVARGSVASPTATSPRGSVTSLKSEDAPPPVPSLSSVFVPPSVSSSSGTSSLQPTPEVGEDAGEDAEPAGMAM